MRSIAVIMTHWNKDSLTDRSIESILSQGYENVNIIVVDDMSDRPYVNKTKGVKVIRIDKRKWVSPVVPYNIGILEAIRINADIVVLQNSEAYHVGDVLKHIDENLDDANYISMGCIAADKENTINGTIKNIIGIYDNIQCVKNDADDNSVGWYNHSVIYPRALDFCSAITLQNLVKLNGFDERFASHYWYGDDNFRNRVKLLGLKTIICDYPYVIHQWHDRANQDLSFTDKSFILYQETINENDYRAKHKITKVNFDF